MRPRDRWRRAAVPVLLTALLFAGGCFLIPNTAPIALFTADPAEGIAPLTVQFDASTSYDPDGTIRSYDWLFGDGGTGSGMYASHTYTIAGTYTVTLTVKDRRWGQASASVTIGIRATNELPVAAFSIVPSTVYPNQAVQFDASASYDPDGEIVSYAWSFGDGSAEIGVTASHAYKSEGAYEATLTVRDQDGGERTATGAVHVTIGSSQSTVLRQYEWMYDGVPQSCNLEISYDLYGYYAAQPRTAWAIRDYDEYVLDPLDDDDLETITQEVLQSTAGDYHAALENALYFVQKCIVYVYDPAWYEYPRYPIETLVDGVGDCEDTAILYTSLVRTLGQGALMVAVDTDGNSVADHMVAWVPVEQAYADAHPDRSFWMYQGALYAFAETAVDGGYLPLGVDPWGLTAGDVSTVYDVSSIDFAPKVERLGDRSGSAASGSVGECEGGRCTLGTRWC